MRNEDIHYKCKIKDYNNNFFDPDLLFGMIASFIMYVTSVILMKIFPTSYSSMLIFPLCFLASFFFFLILDTRSKNTIVDIKVIHKEYRLHSKEKNSIGDVKKLIVKDDIGDKIHLSINSNTKTTNLDNYEKVDRNAKIHVITKIATVKESKFTYYKVFLKKKDAESYIIKTYQHKRDFGLKTK